MSSGNKNNKATESVDDSWPYDMSGGYSKNKSSDEQNTDISTEEIISEDNKDINNEEKSDESKVKEDVKAAKAAKKAEKAAAKAAKASEKAQKKEEEGVKGFFKKFWSYD